MKLSIQTYLWVCDRVNELNDSWAQVEANGQSKPRKNKWKGSHPNKSFLREKLHQTHRCVHRLYNTSKHQMTPAYIHFLTGINAYSQNQLRSEKVIPCLFFEQRHTPNSFSFLSCFPIYSQLIFKCFWFSRILLKTEICIFVLITSWCPYKKSNIVQNYS